VRLAEEARCLAVGHVAARVADGTGQQHMRRHVALRTLEVSQDRADVRVFEAGLEELARLHHLVARIVDGHARVVDGPQQRELVGVLRHAREDFADLDTGHVGRDRFVRTADLGRRVRFGVPGIDLARRPHQEQHDDVDVVVLVDGAVGLQLEQVRQRQAEEPQRPRMQEISPRQPVTEMDGPGGVQTDHGLLRLPRRRGSRCAQE
jgi:hypothetical protein